MTGPEVVHWNPRSGVIKVPKSGIRIRYGARKNNFGDMLGPLVVRRLAEQRVAGTQVDRSDRRMLAVGSILHYARTGDTVWGTGRNGKIGDESHAFTDLDVRAVRGPRTRDWLRSRGIDVPEVYGDPGLLYPGLVPEVQTALAGPKSHRVAVVPNLNDRGVKVGEGDPAITVLDPRRPVDEVVSAIARVDLVVSSSLHGVVLAETMGIPAVLVLPQAEDIFKYEDYVEGTGRTLSTVAADFTEGLAEADRLALPPITTWQAEPLLAAFPADLWLEPVSATRTGN